LKAENGWSVSGSQAWSYECRTFLAQEVAMAKETSEVISNGASSNERSLSLLLVDEDPKDLDYYSMVLQYLGYAVHSVDSYADAAGLLGCDQFDLVIVDQGSSNFEGRTVLTRAVEVDRHIPVLVLTRNVDADCCIDALDGGAYEYVQKPLTAAEVRDLVSDYVKSPTEGLPGGQDFALQPGFAGGDNMPAERQSWQKAL